LWTRSSRHGHEEGSINAIWRGAIGPDRESHELCGPRDI
jgi:hypothetical protein